MSADPLIANAATLIGEPSRARMLGILMDGRARTATELAFLSGVAPPTASGHLGQMLTAGLVEVRPQGRHRYYRLAGPEVARMLETLMVFAAESPRGRALGPSDPALRLARSCYDHLAGRLGVALADALVARGVLSSHGDGFEITLRGEAWLRAQGIDVAALRCSSRRFARCCLDWSERRDHIAGALGAALLEAFLAAGRLERARDGRALAVTPAGRRFFAETLGIELDGDAAACAATAAE